MSGDDNSWDVQSPDQLKGALVSEDPDELDATGDNESHIEASDYPYYDDEWSEMARWEAREQAERVTRFEEDRELLWESEYEDLSISYFSGGENSSKDDERIDYPEFSPQINQVPSNDSIPVTKYWTRPEDERLIELYLAKTAFTEIATSLKRTENAILKRLIRICFPELESEPATRPHIKGSSRWTYDEETRIRQAYGAGESIHALSSEIDRSVSAIYQRLLFGYVAKPSNLDQVQYFTPPEGSMPANSGSPWSTNAIQLLINCFEDQRTLKEMAEIFERTPISILYMLHKLQKISDLDLEKSIEIGRCAIETATSSSSEGQDNLDF